MGNNNSSNQNDNEQKLYERIAELEREIQVLRGNNNFENVCRTAIQFQEKSSSSSNSSTNKEASSNNLFATYKKRQGTNDAGKEFEYMMCALYALKLCTNREIVDFKMTTNNQIYGDFDDISLEIKIGDKTKTFLLQLKHKENEEKCLTNLNLISEKKDFSLTKYLESFEKLNVENVTCLVYTNSPAKLRNGSDFNISFKKDKNTEETKIKVTVNKPQAVEFMHLLQNRTNPKSHGDIFQFDMTEEKTTFLKLTTFCENFFLVTGQDNLETVKATVKKMLISLLEVDIYDSFIFFMKEWWSGRFVLTKHDVISKLVELAMSPWIQSVSSEKINRKTKLLSKGMKNFDMIIVKNINNNIINNMWHTPTDETQFKRTAQKYHIQENENRKSKILWFLDKIPLTVKVDSQNEKQVKKSIELLECLPQKKKLIMVGNVERDDLSKWKVLEKLEDLYCLKDIYNKIIRRFKISLQGRRSINLDELIRCSEDFVDVIEIDDLLKMTQLKWLRVGNIENSFPKSYIPRKVSAFGINTTVLLNELQREEKTVLIINCRAEFKNTLNTVRHASVMEMNEFLKKEKPEKFKNLILLSMDKPCAYSEFESVCNWQKDLQVYLFQANDDCCIHLMNVGDKKLLQNCTKLLIEETEILNCFNNQLNVVFSPPGMGKSTLFNVLSKNCPTNLWVVYVKLIEHNSFLAKQPNEEQFLRHFLPVGEGSELLYKKIQNVYLKNKKLIFLLDGVDELESHNVNLLLHCSKVLSFEGFHVWISSRENWQEKISQDLRLFTLVDVMELTENEQKLYIKKRLKDKYDSSDIEEIVDATFESSDIANSRQLLGIPLQLYIITENFLTNENLVSTLKEENIFVLTTMYRFFFEGKKKFHFKKIGMDERPELIGLSFERHLKQYELPALRVCLDDQTFEKLHLDECDTQEFFEDIKTNGDKFGIIKYVTAGNKAVFFHQTYAEYFACVWFARNLKKVKLLEEEWFSEKYENLRLIFDIMLSEQSPLHLAVIYNNIEQFWKYVDKGEKDKAGRSALYLACCYGMKYPAPEKFYGSLDYGNCHLKRESEIYVEIVHSLLKGCHNILQLDTLFGRNYINYALSSRCLFVIEACLKRKLVSFTEIDKLLQKYYTFEALAFYAAQMNYVHLLQNVLKRVDYNITFENLYFVNLSTVIYPETVSDYTLLWVAIVGSKDGHQIDPKKENVDSVKEILKEMNAQKKMAVKRPEGYIRNCIEGELERGVLLKLACKLGCYEIMRILSTHQTICYGDNILHMTVDFGTLSDEVLELSKTMCLDVNQKNRNGETPLYMACNKGNEQFVENLLTFGAEIDVQNGFEKENVFHVTAKLEKENVTMMQMLLNKMNSEGKSLLNAPDMDGRYPLLLSCNAGHINYVQLLLQNGANINVSDRVGNTALHYAAQAREENEEIMKIILHSGFDINSKNTNSETALHLACKTGVFSNVKFLIDRGSDINSKNADGEIALHLACEIGVFNNVKFLIDRGSDINTRSNRGNSCLHYAQCTYNTETIKFLIGNNVQVNAQNNEGDTPLNFACRFRTNYEIILLENGADAAIINNSGESPLHCLFDDFFYQDCEIITLLLNNERLNINGVNSNGSTALHLALQKKANSEIIEILLRSGADPNISDKDGRNALHLLCIYYQEDELYTDIYFRLDELINISTLLISHGVNINAQDNFGKTPLHLIIIDGRETNPITTKIAEKLLRAGADVNICDLQKNTALHYEAKKFSQGVNFLKLLIKYKANPNLQNSEGQTPLHLAVKHRNWDKVKTLLDSGADINVMDNQEMTVLLYEASNFDEPKTIRLLVDNGVDLNVRNNEGKTALHLAFKTRRYKKVKAFVEFGADVNVADDNKENILHHAMKRPLTEKEERDIIKIFINNDVNINAQNVHRETPLHLAFRNQDLSIVRFLLENGANENLITLEKKNMLHYAAESPHADNIIELLEKGLNKNSQDVNGISILHCACKSGRLENIKILISWNANVHVRDNKQRTILHYAAMSPKPEKGVMRYLVKTGVDIYAKDSYGRNALDVAFEHNCFKALQQLIETNKFFDSAQVPWSTLLYYSAFSGCCHGINYLIENSDNLRNIDCNKHVSLEFLKTGDDLQKDLLLKMTKYVARLIEVYGTKTPFGYKPTRLMEYINFQISQGPFSELSFENLDRYEMFRKQQWEKKHPGYWNHYWTGKIKQNNLYH